MFYISDLDGVQFQGPLEELEAWGKVARKKTIQPLQEDKESFLPPGSQGGMAVAAYRKIISGENMVEPLVHTRQIMSSPVSTIHQDIPLIEAWMMLKTGNFRQLVVVTDQREVVGMLSDRDILHRINVVDDEVEVSQELVVNEVITKEIISTDSMSDIRRVARVLAFYHLDALPVLDQSNLVGIVTRGDVLRGFAENPKLNLWA